MEIRPLIEQYRRTQLTQHACRAKDDLSVSTFQYWHRQLSVIETTDNSTFAELEVRIALDLGEGEQMVIRFPSGMEVHIPMV